MIAEIIAIGSELLSPFKQDTNSLFLTARLNELGVDVALKTVVGDNPDHLVSVARIALNRSDIIIFMGGLGPTEDDLTRESVAQAMRLKLRRDQDLVGELYARFAKFKWKMPENNLKQADVIYGAVALRNANGSAPGQYLEGEYEGKQKIVMLLPGPPLELKPMFMEQCYERLKASVPPRFIATRELRIAMMGESACDALVAPISKEHNAVQTTILAGAGEVSLHLKAEGETMDEAQALVDELADELEDALGEHLYSSKGEKLEQIVGYYLMMRNATLAVAESCTGGLLSERITQVPGSSRYFLGGAITYANELKTLFTGVPPKLIEERGAVSKEVCAAMATGVREETGATIGVGITGVAGPGGGSAEKPVGLVHFGRAERGGSTLSEAMNFEDNGRAGIRRAALAHALALLEDRIASS